MLAIEEQPNLPGTITEHPNWRRRIDAPLEAVFADERFRHRCNILSGAG
jgi:4-alpha-glucanotransferase